MRILVIGIDGAPAELLLAPEALPTVGRLMEIGRYGRLVGIDAPTPAAWWRCLTTGRATGDSTTIGDEVTRQGGRTVVVSIPGAASTTSGAESFAHVLDRIRVGGWDYLHFVDESVRRLAAAATEESVLDALRLVDAQVGETLEALDGETAVLIVGSGAASSPGAFVLADPTRAAGELLEDVHLLDLAPTILALGGYEVPPSMKGTSLPARSAPPTDAASKLAEEEMIRDHLRGLGYL